jgi:hypothetical protein
MRVRRLVTAGVLAVSMAAAGASVIVDAQQTTRAQSAPERWVMPRTADGRPDLQGTYDVATITPIDRPAQYGTRQRLTDAEAAALERGEAEYAERQAANDVPADQRQAPQAGGLTRNPEATHLERIFENGGGTVGGYNNFWIAPGSRVVTVNGEKRSSIIIDPPNGQAPRVHADAARRNAEYARRRVAPDAGEAAATAGPATAFDDPEARPLAERCLLGFSNTAGPPTLPNYFYNNLKQIVQTKDTILIFVEMVHDARIIRMNQPHLPSHIRKWTGDSIGRWEGDTLVVETTNFSDKTRFRGSSENLKVTERFTRTGPDTLVYRFTVEDPTTWERPWTGEYNWNATDERIFEYACHEGNHALENVLRGARSADKASAPR